MEAKHLTSKDIMDTLYGFPALIRKAQEELNEIDKMTIGFLPRENDLPCAARDLSTLLEQLHELIPNKHFIWLRYRFRPQQRFNKRIHRNHNEINKFYGDYFVRLGNPDIELIRQNKKAGDLYLDIEEKVAVVRSKIEYLLGTSELVHELTE